MDTSLLPILGPALGIFSTTLVVAIFVYKKWRSLEIRAKNMIKEKMQIIDTEFVKTIFSSVVGIISRAFQIVKLSGGTTALREKTAEGINKMIEIFMLALEKPEILKELTKEFETDAPGLGILLDEEDEHKIVNISILATDLKHTFPDKISYYSDTAFESIWSGLVALILVTGALLMVMVQPNSFLIVLFLFGIIAAVEIHLLSLGRTILPIRKTEKRIDKLEECKNINELSEAIHMAVED